MRYVNINFSLCCTQIFVQIVALYTAIDARRYLCERERFEIHGDRSSSPVRGNEKNRAQPRGVSIRRREANVNIIIPRQVNNFTVNVGYKFAAVPRACRRGRRRSSAYRRRVSHHAKYRDRSRARARRAIPLHLTRGM